jgi:hypothetical protein
VDEACVWVLDFDWTQDIILERLEDGRGDGKVGRGDGLGGTERSGSEWKCDRY